jgi:hypothetical protein
MFMKTVYDHSTCGVKPESESTTPKRAAIYLCRSSDLLACTQLANAANWRVVIVVKENLDDQHGGPSYPEFHKLVSRAQQDEFEVIVLVDGAGAVTALGVAGDEFYVAFR